MTATTTTPAPRTQHALAHDIRAARRNRARSHALRTTFLVLLVGGLWLASLVFGEVTYSLGDIARVIAGQSVPGASFSVGELRLPRATVAVAVGLAFGIAGTTFQTLLRNQLASPDIIGISSAASAAGVTGIVAFHWSQTAVSAFSLAASLVVAAAIYLLSLTSGFSGTRLILIGIGISAILNSWVTYQLSRAAAWDLGTATRWITGSLNTMSWERGAPLLLTVALCVPLMTIGRHQLAVLRLGDALATGLGLRLNAVRVALIAGAVTLIAVGTATAGPVAFVAFMSGPIATRLYPGGLTSPLPAGLIGAVLVLAADLAGQFALGTRYPVGVITGALGAPFLIYLLTRARR